MRNVAKVSVVMCAPDDDDTALYSLAWITSSRERERERERETTTLRGDLRTMGKFC